MNLVEIQVVCAQAFQGSFNLLLDGFLGETTFIEINLGCDNHVLSLDAEILEMMYPSTAHWFRERSSWLYRRSSLPSRWLASPFAWVLAVPMSRGENPQLVCRMTCSPRKVGLP